MKTVDVTLYELTDTGYKDKTNRPIMKETPVTVSDCLYAPVSTEDVVNTLNLTGKKAVYQLAIPKGDTHNWKDARVEFLGEKWRTIGIPEEGIEGNIPLKWNRKIKVEVYE
jgi:hypothetical protein